MSSLQKSLLKDKLPAMGPPPVCPVRRGSKGRIQNRRDYTPVSWRQYWDECKHVKVEDDVFTVYKRGTVGPVLMLLHGGGYSALTWSLFATSITEMIECQVMAVDQRGHGDTKTSNDADLSADTLARDIGKVMDALYGEDRPTCILMGHSMGGAVAVHAAYNQYVTGISGLIVIDVVEGTALDALTSMQSFLRGRPRTFNSLQNAIEFSIRSGQTRNSDAAKVSMPGQVKNVETGECGTNDIASSNDSDDVESNNVERSDMIKEESEDGATSPPTSPVSLIPGSPTKEASNNQLPIKKYTWRIDLANTEQYWQGWFEGLSSKFLTSSPPKMLLLAGIDRLDTDLTVGQMQGKFQMQVLPQCGHAVHEDVPERVAEVMATFLLRHRLTTAINDFHRSFPAC